MRSYSDDQLISAVPQARSWRGVLQALGLKGTSAGSQRAVRRHADRLGLDYTHFTRQRRWSDHDLRTAVEDSGTWNEVAERLGLSSVSGSNATTLRNHSVRLELRTDHLDARRVRQPQVTSLAPSVRHLRRAGSLIAAAWFELCGCQVSWPLEPCRYDLLVWRDTRAERIQVKTTTCRAGRTWTVQLRTSRKETHTYSPEEVDLFFVIDGDYRCYLIPLTVVGGFSAINLSAYSAYQVPGFTAPASWCPPPGTPTPGSS